MKREVVLVPIVSYCLAFTVYCAICACSVKKAVDGNVQEIPLNKELLPKSATYHERRTFLSWARNVAFIEDSVWIITESNNLVLTSNGGKNWQTVSTKMAQGLRCLAFISKSEGISLNSDGDVLKTYDAGLTWGKVSSLPLKGGEIENKAQMKFSDKKQGLLVVSPGHVWKTFDGGSHWQELHPLESAENKRCALTGGIFVMGESIWLTAEPATVFSSKNGGANWSYQKIQETEGLVYDIFFVSENVGWLAGLPGLGIFRSQDSGNTWKAQLSFVSIYKNPGIIALYFINEQVGWAVGQDQWKKNGSGMGRGVVLQTIDGGKTWRRVKVGNEDSIFSWVHFVDSRRGWIIDRNNVFHSEDGGMTWTMVKNLAPKT